ncbi:MAG: M6 family metalloprotease domain-containing protein [Bacteroidales bacterium]|nr:M6 family metalloprotease domain-containing protein [Bacteroidales bacterium]
MKKAFLFLLPLLFLTLMAQAAYLTNVPRTVVQPNGDTLHCFISGDEFHHWLHDKDGYTIIQDKQTGYYVYAIREGEALAPTSYIAGKVNPASVGLAPYQNISASLWMQKREQMEAPARKMDMSSVATKGEKNHGVLNNIIIFINFADDGGFEQSFAEVNRMFNDSSDNAISMYNFFKQMSFNQLFIPSHFFPAPQGDQVMSYTDSHPRNYFAEYSPVTNYIGYQNEAERTDREHALIERALAYVESMIPESLDLDCDGDDKVDNVCFIVRGEVGDWSSLLWPHKWNLYSRECFLHGKRVSTYNFQLDGTPAYYNTSVFCHEMFHTLSAPDLYHYEDAFSSLSPVGRWDLMSNNTNPPQQTAAYMKYKYGNWIEEIPTITTNGTYTLYPGNSDRKDKMCYLMPCPGRDNEYYAFEYRRQSPPNDSTIYGSGLLVYRIWQGASGNANYNGKTVFDEVYLYRPGGSPTRNGDLSTAHFDATQGRDHIDLTTNPVPYFVDGTIDSLFNISYISEPGDSLVFTIGKYYAQCTPNEVVFEKGIATQQIHLASNTSWEIQKTEENRDWVSIDPIKGTGDTIITITTLTVNETVKDRVCTLMVYNDSIEYPQPLIITQKGEEPYFEVSSDTIWIDDDNLTAKLYIKGNVDWSISLIDRVKWLTIDKMEGIGTDTVTFTADKRSTFARFLSFNLKNGLERIPTLTVAQKGIEPILYVDYPEGEKALRVANKIASTQATLHANMSWRIAPMPFIIGKDTIEPWISISDTMGNGTTELTLNVLDSNNLVTERKATFRIIGEEEHEFMLTIYQDGTEFIASVSTDHVEIGNISGSTYYVTVKANDQWTTAGYSTWYSAKKQNDTTLIISISTFNYGDATLSDTLFVRHISDYSRKKWIPILITQQPSFINLSKDTVLVENRVGSIAKLNLQANTRWYCIGMCAWTSLNKTYGAGDFALEVRATATTNTERTCSINITDRKGTSKYLIVKQLTTVEMDDYLIKNLNIYPNPAHNVVHIDNNQILIDNVTMFDAQGRVVLQKENANDYSVTLNTSSLTKGIYFVRVTGDGHVVTKRVVVQ